MNELPNDVNDIAADLPRDVPAFQAEAIVAKPKRKRKKKAAPKVARAPKVKPIDPLIAEHRSSSCVVGTAAAVEEAPTPSIVQGVGADHLVERRERIHARQFDADVRALVAPPIKSTWAQRFVFSLRHMTGLDGDDTPVRFSTTLTILLCFALVGALAGVARAVL